MATFVAPEAVEPEAVAPEIVVVIVVAVVVVVLRVVVIELPVMVGQSVFDLKTLLTAFVNGKRPSPHDPQ